MFKTVIFFNILNRIPINWKYREMLIHKQRLSTLDGVL